MNKLAVVALSRGGVTLVNRLAGMLAADEADYYLPRQWRGLAPGVASFFDPPAAHLIAELFRCYRGLVLVMAAGIAVRSIAPVLQDKKKDPAVVVVDEAGHHAISLLAGHLGGANDLARRIAALLGGTPVITTASDVLGLPAPDYLAGRFGLQPEPLENLRLVNRLLVNGNKVVYLTEDQVVATGLSQQLAPEYRLPFLSKTSDPLPEADALVLITPENVDLAGRLGIYLRPPVIAAGVGCRRGVAAEEVVAALHEACRQAGYSPLSIYQIGTIELKRDEEGLTQAAEMLGLPVSYYRAAELAQCLADHPDLKRSAIVAQRIGVDGVCEPAALLGAPQGTVILTKTVFSRVTVALVRAKLPWWASAREIWTN